MRMCKIKNILCAVLSCVLIAAALLMTGCDTEKDEGQTVTTTTMTTLEASTTVADGTTEAQTDPVVGQGQTAFAFEVVHKSGETKKFTVKTDKNTVGEALLDAGLIAGENSQYGLYVKTVDNETLDYDTDKMYWAFYVNGEYALSGVDTTEISSNDIYSFRASK